MGSIRTETGIPSRDKSFRALIRSLGNGACGSKSLAVPSSSVVIVKATVDGTLTSKSPSRVTILDLVIIWIRQSFSVRISKHFRVIPAEASIRGYGSDELAIDTISPLSFEASVLSLWRKSFFRRHSEKLET